MPFHGEVGSKILDQARDGGREKRGVPRGRDEDEDVFRWDSGAGEFSIGSF